MKILETIHLRMAGDDTEALAAFVREAADEVVGLLEVRTYRHARVEGDLLVHLQHDAIDHRFEPCELGVRLASILRVHGMVDHSVWISCDAHGSPTEDQDRTEREDSP